MTDYTIGEAADILHVTTRTLRHWDHIGLLTPGWRTWADHRLYTEADLERALQILVYREAGVPLREIAEILAEPATARDTLRRQRAVLTRRIGHLHRMVRAVDELLKEEEPMSLEDRMQLFGDQWKPEYQDEAEERWGDTPEWEQSRRIQTALSDEDWRAVKREQDEFIALLADAAARGVEPGSGEGRVIVGKHRATIARWYPVTPAKQVLLARMYVHDERFDATYQGHAAYLLDLVEAEAAAEGVDLAAVTWE
ncbi:MerR family transcriptional regulator [Corynebacterium sp.]|uniref:MerR family transcriptional regulator n=1 Tax=Corynebacterium sp. TaxID=1720 RepID=UPI00198BA088|nr:MerR family transcriptional regulator [Corynebacterium sp.]HHU66653.1 MerR family transcriptional regulator [Corynebacterium sp.]HKM25033.1 MerR family transcriptional regulator [Corynebacterium sp.]